MLAVLLTILKIIGIIVLSVLLLALLIIAIVLFVPIRYKIIADKSKDSADFFVNVNASFLLHMLSATFGYDKELVKSIKLFGIRIWPKKGSKDEIKDNVNDNIKDNVKDESINPSDAEADENLDFTIDWNEDDPGTGDDIIEDDSADDGFYEKVEKFINGIISKFDVISDKYDKIKRELRFWDKMINDTRNKAAVDVLKNQLIRLLVLIRPRRIKGFIHFGFEDPATCGKVLMYLSMIYPHLPRKLVFDPSFEDTDIYGNVLIKGRIYLAVIAVCLIRMYFNKDIKRMLRLYKKHQNR